MKLLGTSESSSNRKLDFLNKKSSSNEKKRKKRNIVLFCKTQVKAKRKNKTRRVPLERYENFMEIA